jgi:hypothetical protein
MDREANNATPKILLSNVCHNIYEHAWISADEKTQNQIDHGLIAKRRH